MYNDTLRLKAAQRTAPQFRNDGEAAFAKLLGFGALPRILIAESAESKNILRAQQVKIFLRKSRRNLSSE